MEHAFSNRLLLVPLFQGFSRLDFLDIVEKIPFDFRTLQAGKHLVEQNEECRSLCILMGGDVMLETESPDHSYRFGERIEAPWTVQPECLFGLHNRYSHTVRALTEVQAVLLDKQSVRQLLLQLPAFQINFYNSLSTFAQNADHALWHALEPGLVERFTQFVMVRSLRPVGQKELHIRMEDLALQLDATRLRVSKMLADLSEKQLLSYSRGSICIPQLESLTAYNINMRRNVSLSDL